jgi:type I restriction enzyme, S subunit
MNAKHLLAHYERIADTPAAIPRLRRFILDLAVRGKLVPQDPSDEPALELLRRIADEKAQLARAREIRTDTPSKLTSSEELPFDLADGCHPVRIEDVLVDLQTGPFGSSLHQSDYQVGGTPVINPASIQNERIVPIEKMAVGPSTLERLSAFKLRADDIVMGRRGEMGRCAVVSKQEQGWLCGTGSLILRPSRFIYPRFLALLIGSPFGREYLGGTAVGTTMQNLNQGILLGLAFGLPPLAEQHRLVAKVDELMALCDRLETSRTAREATRDRLAVASLARLNMPDLETFQADAGFALDALHSLTTRPDQIGQVRQTILNLAVRGKLVQQDPKDEPAAALLKRIAKEKEQLVKEGKAKRQDPLPEPDLDQAPFELPLGWTWARFPEIGTFGRGKSKHRPRNDPALFDGGEHLMIQTGDVARSKGVIETYTSKYNNFGLAQSFKWPKGTLCITIAANIADSGILGFEACFPDSVVGFIPASMFENARYFEYFVRTAKANLLEFAPATAQKNINLEILTQVLIPLPPLAEQHRIIAMVDALMALCDQLEASLAIADETRRRLLDALLAQALAPAEERELEAAE